MFLGIAFAAYVGAAGYAGSADTFAALRTFGAGWLLAGAAVCTLTFLLRFVRWHSILHVLGHRLPAGYSLGVYLAGLALSSTPGKVGETLRSLLLVPCRVAVHRSLAAFFTARLADVLGFVALVGAVAGLLAGMRYPILELIAVVSLVSSMLVAWAVRHRVAEVEDRQQPTQRRAVRWLEPVQPALSAWALAWLGWRMAGLVLVAVCAYGLQSMGLAAYVARLAPQIDTLSGVAIFASSVLIGAASLLPGGLGVMVTAVVLQLNAKGVPRAEAVATTLATRVSTLRLAWLIGRGSLFSFTAQDTLVDAQTPPAVSS